MKVVNLYDLKQWEIKVVVPIQLIHHFPFEWAQDISKKDYIEFKRVGIVDGESRSYSSRTLFERSTEGCRLQRQKLIAHRYKEGKLLFVKKEASRCPLNNRNEWQFICRAWSLFTVRSLLKILEWSRRQAFLAQDSAYKIGVQKLEELLQSPYSIDTINLEKDF